VLPLRSTIAVSRHCDPSPFQRVSATVDNDGALGEVEIIPAKVAGLAHAQAVAVGHKARLANRGGRAGCALAQPAACPFRLRSDVHGPDKPYSIGDPPSDHALVGNWSQNSGFDQLEARAEFIGLSPMSSSITGRTMVRK